MSLPPLLSRGPLSALLIAASACTFGYTQPPPGQAPGPPPSVAGHPDMTGWRLMGDTRVSGQFEREIIRVGKYEGRVARVMLVVSDSSLDLGDLIIQFGNGQRWSPGVRRSFGDGSRSRAIELPGHVRFIRGVELVRGSVRPGAQAHVEFWGQ